MGVDLLAGRVLTRYFYPLSLTELGENCEIERCLKFGLLPKVHRAPKHAVGTLEAYVLTYLKEEIQHEALVKDVDSFSRFLEVAALANAQVVNYANIARDAGVMRPTVQRYFDILVDTLVGERIPAWQPKVRIKEVAHPKFYFFDSGVVRALRGQLRDALEALDKGYLLETLVLNELRRQDLALGHAGRKRGGLHLAKGQESGRHRG
jgi:predicted AAA+ superfamily ATPase